jgi:putative transposase
MKKAYKYKLKPTLKQQQMLLQHFGCARFIYNWGLDLKIKAYQKDKSFLSYVDLAKQLTLLKKQNEYKWLNEVSINVLQQSLRCLDTAYKNFFRVKKGFPKFKSKHGSKDCCKFINGVYFDFNKRKVKIPKVGWAKICKNKKFDLSQCKLGTLTVSKDKCGTYWATILVDDGKPSPPKAKVEKATSVGIDLGIKDFAILSDGSKFANPKYYEKRQCKLRRLQQRLSKKTKGSKNRDRAKLRLATCSSRIANCRSDYLQRLSTYLVQTYDTICIEDLNVEGMLKNHNLAKSISSASWSEFRQMLTYKCEWYGKNLFIIDRFEPSSKTCNNCGYVYKELTLSERAWKCPICGEVLDRDMNAAKNVRDMALRKVV